MKVGMSVIMELSWLVFIDYIFVSPTIVAFLIITVRCSWNKILGVYVSFIWSSLKVFSYTPIGCCLTPVGILFTL